MELTAFVVKSYQDVTCSCHDFVLNNNHLRWYHTLQGDTSLKSVECFDHMMFVCRFQASR